MKLNKRQQLFAKKVPQGKTFVLDDALKLLKECTTAKFKESVDMAVNLGVDAKKSDQNVRGSTVLPHGNGKSVKVAVFTQGNKAKEALDAGADAVGMQDLADKMKAGDLGYHVVIASPDAMRVVGTLGQVLGPRGLMPNPKTGTVTDDIGRAVREFKGGRVEYRTDRYGNIHVPIGKVSFDRRALLENVRAVVEELQRAKPAAAKGRYMRGITLSSTMGPGVRVDPNPLRAIEDELTGASAGASATA